MRLFHLLPKKWGLAALRNKHIKIARFSDLNDPFELLGANLRSKAERDAFRRWKVDVSKIYGLLCFSRNWQSPVLWSHYGEKHHGLCLGFDIPDEKVLPVVYQDARIELGDSDLTEATIMQFLSTKFGEWGYEKEVRVITDLTDKDPLDGNFYADFGEELKLREVIVGALSDISRSALVSEIEAAALDLSQIEFKRARLAFKSYAVVEDKRGLA